MTEDEMADVLAARAEALARPLAAADDGDAIELTAFAVGPERYAVDSRDVGEVVVVGELTPVPGVPAFWRGIVNVRGTLYPVLDLGRYLGLPDGERPPTPASVVLVHAAGRTIGIGADEAPEIRRIAPEDIGPPLAAPSGAARAALRGTTADLLTVLDVEALLTDPTLVVQEEAT